MGVRLDWEVESDGGWEEVGEDPQAIADRQRRNRRIRNAILAFLVLLAALSGAILYRLRQVSRQLAADLEATVAAETLALRIGDLNAFLAIQSGVGGWPQIQESAFDQARALGTRLEVTGEIVDTQIDAKRARVTLRENLDGQPYLVVWFYEHGDGGWLHIPPNPAFWGEGITRQTEHIHFYYREADEPLADLLTVWMNGWWDTGCELTACVGRPQPLRVRIEVDPLATTEWASYSETTLIIPSPLLGRVPEGQVFDPQVLSVIADLLAERRAALTMGDDNEPHSDAAWIKQELRVWLRDEFDASAPPSTFLAPLVEGYGTDIVPPLLDVIRQGEEILPALLSLTGSDPLDLPVAWDGYLAHRLQAEAALIAGGHPTEAILLFRDRERSEQRMNDIPVEALAIPETIRAIGTYRAADLTWVEVEFEPASASATGTLRAFEPFRVLDNRWVHTMAQVEDWGASRREQSEHFTLDYYELDAPAVEGLLAYLEVIHGQVAADFGLPETTPVGVLVLPTGLTTAFPALIEAGRPHTLVPETSSTTAPLSTGIQVVVASPFVVVREAGITPPLYVQSTAARGMIEDLVANQIDPFPADHPLAVALMRWGFEQNGVEGQVTLTGLPDMNDRTAPESLEVLWWSVPHRGGDYIAASALIEQLVETSGAQIIPHLLRNLPTASGMDDWLFASAGIRAADIEVRWRARVEAALAE